MTHGTGKPAVPPTPYYYGARAEWFRNEANKALENNLMEKYYYLFNRYLEYEQLAEQLPLFEIRTPMKEGSHA